MRTNCVNCGAAIDTDVTKCPFCGTSYFDLTALDFTSHEPVALRLKMPSEHGNMIFSALARPRLGELEVHDDMVDCYGGMGNARLFSFPVSRNVVCGVTFQIVPKGNTMLQVEMDT